MMKRHSQIGQYAIDTVHTIVAQEIAQIAEIAPHCRKSPIGKGAADGITVLIKRIQVAILTQTLHDGTAMAAAAESGVDIRAAGMQVKRLKRLWQQGWNVVDF